MADDGWGDDGAVIIPVTETEGDGGDEGRRGDSEEGRKIFIGNCGEDVTQDDIQEAAEQHGEITDFYNPGKGFAFLTFSTPEEALACIAAMDGTEVAGQVVRMNIAKPKGEKGGGGGGGDPGATEEGRKIFIHNVEESTTLEEFQDEAQQHGEITDFFNPGRGFAFLTFSTSEEAKACIAAMDGTEVAGKTIQMNLAKPKGEKGAGGDPEEGRKATEEGRKVQVQNVDETATLDELEELKAEASKHGEIRDFFNPGRGFAFLTFSSSAEAKACIEAMNGTEVDGKTIKMNIAENYIPKDNDDAEELYKSGVKSGINFSKYKNIPVKVTGQNVPKGITSFASSGLRTLLLDNIKKSGYTVPTPVQSSAIPIIKAKRDLMACAQTGSGKSAAFLVPIIDRFLEENICSNATEGREPVEPECVIVTPTRELARQIHRQAKKFAQGSVLRAVVTYGETSVFHQMEEVRKGCNILVATPGRLLHFAEKGILGFSKVKVLVLDEADRMLDEGFMEDVQKVTTTADMSPCGVRQTLMFSATFSDQVQESAQEFLDKTYLFLTVGTVGEGMAGGICGDIDIVFHEVEAADKREKLDSLLGEVDKDKIEKTIIFVGKKTSADYLSAYLSAENVSTTSIHGDRTQRQREEALADFTEGRFKILVATAVAARGLDIPHVQHVINYDMPDSADEFIHRIGRTARVGNLGKATSLFCSETDFKIAPGLVKVLNSAGKDVPDYIASAAESEGGGDSGTVNGGGDDEDEW